MSNLQKFIRLESLSLRILIFIALFSQLILSQDAKKTQIDGVLQNIDLSNPFKICWELKNEGLIHYSVASDNTGYQFVSSIGGIIKSFKSESGEKRWETDLGGEIISTPILTAKMFILLLNRRKTKTERLL